MLILASRSKARQALLSSAVLSFDALAPAVDERAVEAELGETAPPDCVAAALAKAKAQEVSRRVAGAWVIGADQTLAFEGRMFHKPETLEAARAQLAALRGRTHRLQAGIALARDGEVVWSHVDSAELTMREFSAAERDAVLRLEGEGALDSVGAYRLEGPSVRLFDSVKGDYFTILGLPLLPLLGALRRYAPEVF
ncbi:MAG TPA: Maf family protein [Devosia sp.]|nr:Maf family protein [Devosia sp.]